MARLIRAVSVLCALALINCGGGGKGGGGGVHHSTGNLQPGWLTSDVGAVGYAGNINYDGSKYTVSGSGADIWDSADAFRFVYRTLSGDGEMIAHVASLDNTDDWAKAGVMIRETLAPGSTFAMTVVTPSNGTSFQYRPVAGGGCSLAWGPAHGAPYWVRIVRAGNTISGYASADGSSWTLISSQTIPMATSVYIGLCVTAHNNGKVATAVFDSVSWTGSSGGGGGGGGSFDMSKLGPDVYHVTAAVIDGDMHATFASVFVQVANPVAGNNAPNISAVTATPSTIAPRGTVQLSASATDADGDPLRFAWIVPAGETTCSPSSTETWTAPSQAGTYILRCMVSDGKVWTSSTVNVTVSGANPTTGTGNHPAFIRSLTQSATSVTPGSAVQLTIDADDVDGPALTYAWMTPGGGSISGSGTSVTWNTPTSGGRPSKAGLWVWPRSLPAGCPVPLSTDMPGIAFVGRAGTMHFCDTWMPTWASDNSMYSPWQDGSLLTPPFVGLGGWHAGDDPAQNGWAKIWGDDPQDLLIPNAGILYGPKGNWNSRYPAAIFAKDGVVYYGVRAVTQYDQAGNQTTDPNQYWRYAGGTFTGFFTSTDGGASWSASPDGNVPLFNEPNGGNKRLKFAQPYMVDHGQNQQHSPDGKVYFVSSGSTDTSAAADHLNDDQVYLCRVTASAAGINNIANWEFWTGSGWSGTLSAAQPIFEWRNQVSGATMTWNPGLGKYIMLIYRNGYNIVGTHEEFVDFDTYILESSSMTGPWKLVHYWPSFGTQGYYPNLPSKFLSGDGRNAWLWYGANFSPFDRAADPPGSGYHLCEQRIRFLTAADTP